ncbi:P-loop containing nucleoside triphosphate hydrolase protein [Penicillium herquei]|nr:P-loop containing nucleoside triphosphate hydrolase protein [Penicillium herquei]
MSPTSEPPSKAEPDSLQKEPENRKDGSAYTLKQYQDGLHDEISPYERMLLDLYDEKVDETEKDGATCSNTDSFNDSEDLHPRHALLHREPETSEEIWRQLKVANKSQAVHQDHFNLQTMEIDYHIEQLEKRLVENSRNNVVQESMVNLHSSLQMKRNDLHRKNRERKQVQEYLRLMGHCCLDKWIKVEGGYRCEGGSHFVSDAELYSQLVRIA